MIRACEEQGHAFSDPSISSDEEQKKRPKERTFWAFCSRCGSILECGLGWGSRPTILAPEVLELKRAEAD